MKFYFLKNEAVLLEIDALGDEPTLARYPYLPAARADVLTSVAVLAWGAGFTAVPVCLQAAVMRVAADAQDAASAVYVVAFQIAVLAVLAAVVGLSARRSFPLRAPAHEPVAVR